MFVARGTSGQQRGGSILELVLVMLLTGIIFAVTQIVIVRTIDTWWRVNANQESEQQLYRAQSSLERDLRAAAFELESDRATVGVQKAPPELQNLAGADGDVLWFLSATDPLSGNFQRSKDGAPFWQRNVVYYAVSPLGLAGLDYLGAGRQSGGYEVACPYKILVRKEIDFAPPTSPGTNPTTTTEKLMTYAELSSHINRPNGYSCAGMAASNATVKPVSAHVLTFRADLIENLRGISVDVRCTAIDRARRDGAISDRDLSVEPSTTQLQFILLPPNRPPPPPP
jgi:type II secretory pathway pseudopilin PulG